MGTERTRELRRRRHRKKKVAKILDRASKGVGDKAVLVQKLRRLTPGAQVLIDRHGLA